MDPSSGQHQEMLVEKMIGDGGCSKGGNQQQERKARPQPEQALKCPRCDSTNTKFCYYNNYSLSQPRYFCKSCRRYWTKGGTLRNVPVGGGCRKNKRSSNSSSSSSSSSASSKRGQEHHHHHGGGFITPSNPLMNGIIPTYDHHPSDLTLALARLQKQSCGMQLGYDDHDLSILGNPTSSLCDIIGNQGLNHSCSSSSGFLDALKSGMYYSSYENIGGEVVDNGNANGGVMHLPYDDHHQEMGVGVNGMKQEHVSEGRVLGGFPWQHNLSGDNTMGDLDSANRPTSSWNAFSSSWHGLLNSPLM